MARTIARYEVLDFSGGIRRDKSAFTTKKDELLDLRNLEIEETGRLITRRGSQQFGNTLTGTIENSFVFVRSVGGSAPAVQTLVNNSAGTGVVSRLIGTRLTANVATADTTINVIDASNFSATGTVEIDGDLIAYTGTTATTLTGCSGIATAHLSGRAVHQWATLTQSGSAVDGRSGMYYAVINNILIFGGRAGNLKQYDGTTVTDVSSEPAVILLTNYRDRLFGAGDGSSGTNGDPRRISFSNRGDGTTWTTASDYFDVEDQRGEYVTGHKVLKDTLGIFKTNSIFTYDEVELKQRVTGVGAYNQKVIQEIDGVVYTFCPNGIFATNLFEAKSIGDPVREFWKGFFPTFDTTTYRVVTNVFAGVFEDHYLLFINNVTSPESLSNVVLDYNTKTKSWAVHTGGFTNFAHFGSRNTFDFGDSVLNYRAALFAGDTGGKVWRLYENRYVDNQATPVFQGTDIFNDLVSNTGSVVSGLVETPLYDLTYPNLYKIFKRLRVYSERGIWNVQYRTEDENGISAYRPMGTVSKNNATLPFPKEAQGYRIGFKFSSVSSANTSVFNGFVIENTQVRDR